MILNPSVSVTTINDLYLHDHTFLETVTAKELIFQFHMNSLAYSCFLKYQL